MIDETSSTSRPESAMTWQAIEDVRDAFYECDGCGDIRFSAEIVRAAKEHAAALSVVEEALEAAAGVMTQMDYETPHHTRLHSALARAREGIKP